MTKPTKPTKPTNRVRHRTRRRTVSKPDPEPANPSPEEGEEGIPSSNQPDDYKVGYKKPPKDSQFKKGQSGHSEGRPKQARNYRTIVQHELDTVRTVRRDGQQFRLPTRHVLVLRLIEKGLSGDLKALKELLVLDDELVEATRNMLRADPDQKITSESDRAIMDTLIKMVTGKQPDATANKDKNSNSKETG